MAKPKEEKVERNFKYFYDSLDDLCKKDDRDLVVASEKPINKSSIKGCAYDKFIEICFSNVNVGDTIDIIFGDPRSANNLTKISECGENLPDFIKEKGDAEDFAVYKFKDGNQAILDETFVCVRKWQKTRAQNRALLFFKFYFNDSP